MGRAPLGRMLVLGVLAAAGLCYGAEERAAGPGRWQDLKVPGGNVAVDSGGALWVNTSEGLRYWDGERFLAPAANEMEAPSADRLCKLYGDPGVGAYALVTESPHQGRAYRLQDGEVRFVTDFYYDGSLGGRGFCVSRAGVMINWGQRFLATRQRGQWRRIEARLGREPAIAQTPHHAVFAADGWIYTVDEQGKITEIPAPVLRLKDSHYGGRITALPAGNEKVVISNAESRSSYVFNADTGEMRAGVPVGYGQTMPPSAPRLFTNAEGALVPAAVPTSALIPPWVVPSTWSAALHLAASDGSYWSVLREGLVTRYKDRKLTLYDWRDGLMLYMPTRILEGTGGQVFVCSSRTIYVFRPDQEPLPPPAWHALWKEVHLVLGASVVQDSEGRLWMRRRDKPQELSVWDGHNWQQCAVPFDLAKMLPILTDDRGHVLLARSGLSGNAYEVGLDGTRKFKDVHAMLVALAAEGVREFRRVGSQWGCVVLPDGRIWYGQDYYDGQDWAPFYGLGSSTILESARYGVVFGRYDSRRWSIYDRGQFVELPLPEGRGVLYLFGPDGYQPFERELMERHPGRFLPVARTPDGKLYLLREPLPAGNAPLPLSALGDPAPDYRAEVRPGVPPLYYLSSSGRPSRWIVQGKTFEFDFAATPMQASSSGLRQILVDGAHNLWFVRSFTVFIKRMDEFRVAADPIPERVTGGLSLNVRLEEPGLPAGQGYVFWRINDGPWRGGLPPGEVPIPLDESGDYRVELIGVDPQSGVTPQPLNFSFGVRLAIPETQVTVQGPYTVKDVFWQVPVKAVPSSPEARCTIMYRIDGGEWQSAEGGRARTGGLPPGRHTAEFAARQQGGLRDQSPVRVEFDYRPDYEFIVESRMDALSDPDPEVARRAMDEIRSAGPDVMPVLERKLQEARRAARMARELQRAIEQLSE